MKSTRSRYALNALIEGANLRHHERVAHILVTPAKDRYRATCTRAELRSLTRAECDAMRAERRTRAERWQGEFAASSEQRSREVDAINADQSELSLWPDAALTGRAEELQADLIVSFVEPSEGRPFYVMRFVGREPPHAELDRVLSAWCGFNWAGCVIYPDGFYSWVKVAGTDRYRPRETAPQ